jgi:PAS domain S-box-containing protein
LQRNRAFGRLIVMPPRVLSMSHLAGLALMILASLALAALEIYQAFWNAPKLSHDRELVSRTFETINTARALEMAVRDAERAQRNSLLERDLSELAQQRAATHRAPQLLARLQSITADNPAERARMPELARDIESMLAELERIAQVHDSQGPDAALQLVRAGQRADPMASVHTAVESIVNLEDSMLRQRQAGASATERLAARTAASAAALAFALITIGAILTLQAFGRMLRSEEALRAKERELRILISGVTDYAIYMLDPDGRVTSWNTGAQRIKGYDAQEILGQHFSRFYTEEDRSAGLPRTVLETAAREGRYEAEAWRVRKDGSRFWASVIIDAIRSPAGSLLGFAKVTRDISERQERDQQLARMREILAQSQKMDALGQLTGGIAHDINNVLTVIRNAVDGLERRLRAGERDVSRYVDAIGRSADRATSLTQRLLAFARRQPLEPRALDANKLVTGLADMLKRTLPAGITTETVLAGGLWWTQADPSQLESAVLNLVLNARDAMPGGGKLTIETGNAFLDERYAAAHAEVSPGQYVMVAVSDTGGGMSADIASRAFEPFFTTKEIGHGTGLGLSQVYGFVKQSHGHVKIYTETGSGTTVKIYLPRLEKPQLSEPVAEVSARVTRPAEESILLVEDDDEVREFVSESLGELGYRVFAAADARTALRTLDAHRDIDLLFTDVGLPEGMNGRALADEARNRHPGIKVLFTTGYAPNAIVHHGRLDSGVDLITKPYTQTGLAARVRTILDR